MGANPEEAAASAENPYQAPASAAERDVPERFSPIPFAGQLSPEFLSQALGQRRYGAAFIVILSLILICGITALSGDQMMLVVTLVALAVGAWVVRYRLQPPEFPEIDYRGTIREEGIEIQTQHARSRSAWACYRRSRELGETVLLFPDSASFVLLHRSFFQDEGDWQTARRAALSRTGDGQQRPPVANLEPTAEETAAVRISGVVPAGLRRRLDYELFRVLRSLLLACTVSLAVLWFAIPGPHDESLLVFGSAIILVGIVVAVLIIPRWRSLIDVPVRGVISDAGLRSASPGAEALFQWSAFTHWQVVPARSTQVLLLESHTGSRHLLPRDVFADDGAWRRACELCDLHIESNGTARGHRALPRQWWLTPLTLLAVAGALTYWEIEKALASGPLSWPALAAVCAPLVLMLLLSWWMLPGQIRRRLLGKS